MAKVVDLEEVVEVVGVAEVELGGEASANQSRLSMPNLYQCRRRRGTCREDGVGEGVVVMLDRLTDTRTRLNMWRLPKRETKIWTKEALLLNCCLSRALKKRQGAGCAGYQ
jgi:hypothetical protein